MSNFNRIDINMEEEPAPLYIRTGALLKHPDSKLVVPYKGRIISPRIRQGLYFFFYVNNGLYTLTTPYGQARITKIDLDEGEIFYFRLQNLMAFSDTMFPRRKWKIDLLSFIQGQYKYYYLQGPGRAYLFGLGELQIERIKPDTGPADYDRGAVLGFSSGLRLGASTRSSMGSAILAKEEICLDHFEGEGFVLTQAAVAHRLPRPFHDQGVRPGLLDYIQAIMGLGN